MRLSNLVYRSPRLLALALALITVAGLASLELLPRAEDPELTPRNAQIFTAYPGASAARVEALVTDRIEDMLAEFDEIKELKSTARAGLSTVAIELFDHVEAVAPVWTEIRDDLAALDRSLPTGVLPSEFVDFELAAYTLMVALTWDPGGAPERAIMGRAAEELADALRGISGTNDVVIRGAPDEEILVELDPGRLAALGLDAGAVSAAILAADAKVAAGELFGDANEIQLEVSGEIESLARIEEIIVDRGGAAQVVRLRDIASVRKAEARPRSDVAVIDGAPGIVVAARMQVGRRVDVWSTDALAAAGEFIDQLPAGIHGEILFDQSRYTNARLGDLIANFLMGAGLVMVVMLFTMGWRAAILVGAALPLTTLMVLQGLRTFGVPLDQMSVTGMIIALGLLIDNAIVVVDEVRHRLAEGMGAADAVSETVRHLAVPLLGSTLTTCMAFAPIALMPGSAGEFVGPIAVSVILAVASSFVLALTITPALAGLLDSRFPPRSRDGFVARGLYFAGLDRLYGALIGFLVRRPVLGVAVACVAPLLGFLAAPRLPEQFFPPADRDQFNVQIYLGAASSLDHTEVVARRARDVILEHDAVDRVHLFLGESGPKYYYNLIETLRDAPYYAQAMVQLHSPKDSVRVIRAIQDALDAALPDAVVLAQQIEQGPPFDAPVEMHVFGPDLARLQEVGDQVRRTLTEIPHVTHVRSTLDPAVPVLRVDLNETEARLAGLDNVGLAAGLQLALTGAVGGSLVEETEELPVRVRLAQGIRGAPERIANLPLRTATGWTSLSALGELSLVPETAAIAHRNRSRVYTVQGFLEAGVLPSRVLAQLQERLDRASADGSLALPPGFRLEVGGESAKRDEAVGNLVSSAALLLVLMAASLVLTFNSFRLASIIGAVGLLSVGLALLAVAAYGAPFGFMTIVGAMGLIGIAINDSIVVLAALRNDEGARTGDPDATVRIVRRSSRHVISTSLTTIAGFAPLIIAGGAFWPPLAVAIAGGVLGATLIAITLVPAAHGVVARRNVGAAPGA